LPTTRTPSAGAAPLRPGKGRMPLRILLNYRRGDTAGNAGRLYEALEKRFGEENVFMDIDKIEPGLNFVEVIKRWVGSCDVFLAMIGQHWLTAVDQQGQRRLDDPGDFVRLELEAALGRDVRLIPILVQDVEMPRADELPPSLKELALRNGLEIRDVSWQYDVDRLIQALEKIAGPAPAAPGDPGEPRAPGDRDLERRGIDRKRLAIGTSAAVLCAAVVGGLLLLRDGDPPAPPGERDIDTGWDRVVFAENGRIYTVGLNGSDEVDLTRTRGRDHQPDWSPNGQRLALARAGDIVVIDAAGGDSSPLTDGSDVDNAPSWSPDGAQIAFDRAKRQASTGTHDVWVVETDGTESNLTDGPDESGGAPDWSGDGARIVYQRRGALWTMRADGSDQRKVQIDLRGSVHEPSWSPRSDEIAFALYTGASTSDIYVYAVDDPARPPRNLTNGAVREPTFPAWSSDGQRIVFAAADGIWTMNRDGSARTRLTSGRDVETPSWRPPRG
jgi:hypothetical protein